jgi:hypothetical protein
MLGSLLPPQYKNRKNNLSQLTQVISYQVGTPFATSKGFFSIIYQHYRFVVNGPSLIKKGHEKFPNGLFEIPRTFRFGQVVLCKLELIEELKSLRSTAVSPEPWIDQVGYAMLY